MLPKLPRDIASDYTIPQAIRTKFKVPDYVLVSPIADLVCVENQINAIPSNVLLGTQASFVYTDIKDALYSIMNCEEVPYCLPLKVRSYLKLVHSTLTLEKTKKKFVKLFNAEVTTLKKRGADKEREDKIAQSRKRTYEEAQILGSDLIRQSIHEFRQEYIDESSTSSRSSSVRFGTNLTNMQQSIYTNHTDSTGLSSKQNTSNDIHSNQDSPDDFNDTNNETILDKNNKKFIIYNPASYLTTPHKPKLQIIDQDRLKDVCSLGMEFLENTFTTLSEKEEMLEYKENFNDQKTIKSLKSLYRISHYLKECLSSDIEELPKVAWNHAIHTTATGITKKFARVIALSLTDFSSNCKQVSNTNNHERTGFVKYVVPAFKYLSQETGLIEMAWCEKSIETQACAGLECNDYNTALSIRKFADGLGVNTTTRDEELFMEASSGISKEEISHSLDDTIKILVECSNALNYIIKKNKRASFESICQKATFGIQMIVKTLTLSKMTLKKTTNKWKLVELRSSGIPVDWKSRFAWVSMFELMATLLLEQMDQEKVDEQLIQEVSGFADFTSPMVYHHFMSSPIP